MWGIFRGSFFREGVFRGSVNTVEPPEIDEAFNLSRIYEVTTSVVRKNSLARVLDHEYLFFDTRTHSYSSGFHKTSIERVEY